jgi:hypothetical protein
MIGNKAALCAVLAAGPQHLGTIHFEESMDDLENAYREVPANARLAPTPAFADASINATSSC